MVKKTRADSYISLNKLWVSVVIICTLLIVFGIIVSLLSYGILLLSPEDTQVSVEIVSDTGNFKSAVNFILAGIVIALFVVTIVLLIVFLLKRKKEKKPEIPKFDVFGIQSSLK